MKPIRKFMKFGREEIIRYKYHYMIIIVLTFTSAMIELLSPAFLAELIGSASSGIVDPIRSYKNAGILLILYVTGKLALYYRKRLVNNISYKVIRSVTDKLMKKVLELDQDFINKTSTQSLMNIICRDVTELRELFGHIIPDVFSSVITIVVVGYILITANWKAAIIVMIPGPFCYIACSWLTKKITPLVKVSKECANKASEMEAEAINGIREVHLYNKEAEALDDIHVAGQKWITEGLKSRKYGSMYGPVCGFIFGVGEVLTILVSTYFVSKGLMSSKDVALFVLYIWKFYNPFCNIVDFADCIQESSAAIDKIYDLFSQETRVIDRAETLVSSNPTIAFDKVSFTYGDKDALSNVTFTVNPGEMMAIVGPTGAGKSTITNLLYRFYDVTNGTIKVDGKDIREVAKGSLRGLISAVPQDTYLFNATVAENIAYSTAGATMDDIIRVAKAANIHDDIMNMEKQYDTVVGDRGVRLSGGQKQRIAIARALLRDTPVIVLDEATSAVDNETEKKIQNAIDKLGGKTIIAIAHRLSTIQKADKIIYLDKGKIMEVGTHNELMEKKGLYYKMQTSQK